jgi:hypothetical protein
MAHQPGHAFQEALAFAMEVHGDDVRKGDPPIPYLSHLLAVAALVLEDGGSETEAVAGLLHDCAEDHGGHVMLARIRERFGDEVADIVAACSDSLLPGGEVKEECPRRPPAIGDALWERFSTRSGHDQLWYYRQLAGLFLERRPQSALARELAATVDAIAQRLEA